MTDLTARGRRRLLKRLRLHQSWVAQHQEKMGTAWDESLRLLSSVDFTTTSRHSDLRKLRRAVRTWHDFSLETPKRLASIAEDLGPFRSQGEAVDYLCRVFIGYEIAGFNSLCDTLDGELNAAIASEGSMASPEWRDRLVELMELAVSTPTRALDWIREKIKAIGEGEGEAQTPSAT